VSPGSAQPVILSGAQRSRRTPHFVARHSTGSLDFARDDRLCAPQINTRAQQLIRETSRSLTEIAPEVGYSKPSHFAKVFWKVADMTPTEVHKKFTKFSRIPKDFQTGLRKTCHERTDTINGSVPNNPYRPT
jgi:hypothetical protein